MAIKRMSRGRGGITTVLSFMLFVGVLFFFFSPSSDPDSVAARQRKSDAAAANPLSPPTSAFRKSTNPNGRRSPPPVVHYQLNNLSSTPNPIANKERILVLTPITRFYQGYWDNLLKITYPHEYISLGYIIPKTPEGNKATTELQRAIAETQSGPESDRFQSITIIRQDFEPPLHSQSEAERHKMENQKARRTSMARARNSLLFTTLGPHTSWVLWLDSDIIETPAALIQDLASFDKPIIVPNCFQRYYNPDTKSADIRPYDYNSWRDSDTAQDLAAKMGPDDILLEGYAEMATYRTLMAHLAETDGRRDQRKIMPLDGVGGTALMVKAEVHRDGAMFPPFPFYHLVETEGFAKMARRLGWESWGLPNYLVSFTYPSSSLLLSHHSPDPFFSVF
jgi:mannan polymerase complexes MNN9 subunit